MSNHLNPTVAELSALPVRSQVLAHWPDNSQRDYVATKINPGSTHASSGGFGLLTDLAVMASWGAELTILHAPQPTTRVWGVRDADPESGLPVVTRWSSEKEARQAYDDLKHKRDAEVVFADTTAWTAVDSHLPECRFERIPAKCAAGCPLAD